jgi:hypothetical protein
MDGRYLGPANAAFSRQQRFPHFAQPSWPHVSTFQAHHRMQSIHPGKISLRSLIFQKTKTFSLKKVAFI